MIDFCQYYIINILRGTAITAGTHVVLAMNSASESKTHSLPAILASVLR